MPVSRTPSSPLEAIRSRLVGLKMARALEVLDDVVAQLEQKQLSSLEAIDLLLAEEFSTRENRRIKMALMTARLTQLKTLDSFDLAEERPYVAELVMPPMLKQTGSFRCYVPVIWIWKAAPVINMAPESQSEAIANAPVMPARPPSRASGGEELDPGGRLSTYSSVASMRRWR